MEGPFPLRDMETLLSESGCKSQCEPQSEGLWAGFIGASVIFRFRLCYSVQWALLYKITEIKCEKHWSQHWQLRVWSGCRK